MPKFECERKQKEFNAFQDFKEHLANKETPPIKMLVNRVTTEELEEEKVMDEVATI